MRNLVVADTAERIRRELERIDAEAAKLRKALAALNAIDGTGKGIRARRNIVELKCRRCGKTFTSNRKDAMFCHDPCTSLLVLKEKTKAAAAPKPKPTTLVKGDQLKAGHP